MSKFEPFVPHFENWSLENSDGKRWRIESRSGWTMQPVGNVTAAQAEAICKRVMAATAAWQARPDAVFTALCKLLAEAKDWAEALAGERPSLTEAIADAERAISGVSSAPPSWVQAIDKFLSENPRTEPTE